MMPKKNNGIEFKLGQIFGSLEGIKTDVNDLKAEMVSVRTTVEGVAHQHIVLETKFNEYKKKNKNNSTNFDKKLVMVITGLSSAVSTLVTIIASLIKGG